MLSRQLSAFAITLVVALLPVAASAEVEPPDALIKRVSSDVLEAVRADPSIQAGNVDKVVALVDAKILPDFDFQRMTASAVGPRWRDATPAQQERLRDEFKILLVRAYSGALAQGRDRTVQIEPVRGGSDAETVVRSKVSGRGDPVELDFRLANGGQGWKIHDVNIGGVWLVEIYRGSFAQEIAGSGIDGLIEKLAARNQGAKR